MSITSIDLGGREALELEAAFRSDHPRYADTWELDELRRTDYAGLDRDGHVYLDYMGGGLFAASQLTEHAALLQNGVFGNPHSSNPTSAASTELVERARDYVLEYFGASLDLGEVPAISLLGSLC